MKKVLVAGAALMLVSGSAATVHAIHFPTTEPAAAAPAKKAEIKPGVALSGDARVRLGYTSEDYDFGNNNADSGRTDMDSRVRLNITGTAAGGAYAKARIRMYESLMGDLDTDPNPNDLAQNNIWVDIAHVGIPFGDDFTLELGKYRSTYGPLGATHNFFYDDVHLTGGRGIWKIGGVTVNPFIEWMEESGNYATTNQNRRDDNDAIRYGIHAKGKINKDWTLGGMLGYQNDERLEDNITPGLNYKNDGFFGSIYTIGRSGAFGFVGELAVTDSGLNNFNAWEDDFDGAYTSSATADRIGSDDVGWGGYVFPNYQVDKLNIGLNLGFTDGGFTPDRAFGFVMLGSSDNSRITAMRIGDGGDWLWAGLVAEYSISESLKLTGNLVYADVEAWDTRGPNGEGPTTVAGAVNNAWQIDNAWEVSAVLQYTISKGADVFFSAGYLKPEFETVNGFTPEDDGAFGALSRFELKF